MTDITYNKPTTGPSYDYSRSVLDRAISVMNMDSRGREEIMLYMGIESMEAWNNCMNDTANWLEDVMDLVEAALA